MDQSDELEVERRFLVSDQSIVEGCDWVLITQAYVYVHGGRSIRVRLLQEPNTVGVLRNVSASLGYKGPWVGPTRVERETELPIEDAREMINTCANVVVKRRYQVVTDQTWEVDQFLEANAGLWIAEIEGADAEDVQKIRKPQWASREVTGDYTYNNDHLSIQPYTSWGGSSQPTAIDYDPRDF